MRHTNLLPGLDVSRETFLRLKEYEKLLFKWNLKINLVAKSTLDNFWNRHVLDSAQFLSLVGEKNRKMG
jgi:16S rRNA (guanine527-N7)-methyltransferase